MTDQRDRVITDPGLGPIDVDNSATLRSIDTAVEVEPDGAAYYYEPKPLVAVSDHRTIEIQTVKLSADIDPRKLQTELSLPRSPTPPRYDSGWPQADIALTTSQRPAPLRRWRVPAVLLTLLGGLLLLVLARGMAQRAANAGSAPLIAPRSVAALQAAPAHVAALAAPAAAAPSAAPSAALVASAPLPKLAPSNDPPSAQSSAQSSPARAAARSAAVSSNKPVHSSAKPSSQVSASAPLSTLTSAKPKAIY